ncbi:hypothetical protein BpHYR1_045562 [Brachionus plicatilis]|uniref:Uncharacterized protein n=1 Tax=Brachionus plicatilis TaxID=10195 RepID=A0A3M7QM77_BRAPC|nr:hypothetical protein BpHYR1_045562 [Brachionus plicatilis]
MFKLNSCNIQSCIKYQGLLNLQSLAQIKVQCNRALGILQRFCTSLADFYIFPAVDLKNEIQKEVKISELTVLSRVIPPFFFFDSNWKV